jgi:hypothetical protein
MKTKNSQLDDFLCNSLKNINVQYQQPDWEDMEQLLGPVQKPIPVNVDKKTILIGASALLAIIIVIIISQTVHFNSSPAEETLPQNTDSSNTLLSPVDSHIISDSSNNQIEETVDSEEVNAKLPSQKISPAKNSTENISKKIDTNKKKNKLENTSTTDSSAKTITEPATTDTASKQHQEIAPPTPSDSSKKSRKDIRGKLKSLFRQKSDSLR